MPGFTTHYLFGLNTYKQLNHLPIKKIIKENPSAYSLGLQGPDIFFYFLPSHLIHSKNIGSIAHQKHTGKFLYYLLESHKLFTEPKEQRIADAYIAGSLGHYVLDTCCHPYIYWKTDFQEKSTRYYGNHVDLESVIDTELLQFYKHRLPSQFREDSTIMLTRLQMRIISSCLSYAYAKTYPELRIFYAAMWISIRSMQVGIRLLHDSTGRKKPRLERLEYMVLGYPLLSSMIPSDSPSLHHDPLNVLHRKWHNPWDETFHSTDSFFDLLEDSQTYYTSILTSLSDILFCSTSPADWRAKTNKLLKKLGNKSYHSGLKSGLPE